MASLRRTRNDIPSSDSSSESEDSRSSSPLPPDDPSSSQSETQKAVAGVKPGYPATALVNILLQHYGIDFAKYKRNVRTSRKLWELWKSVYEAILAHMDNVHNADETPDWDSFLKYTEAIGPFEEELLKLEPPLNENEIPAVPTKDDVTALITFMTKWVVNRQQFIDTSRNLEEDHYTTLFSHPLAAEASVKQALSEDDKQILRELSEKIDAHPLEDGDILGSGVNDNFVTAVKSKVQDIHNAAGTLTPEDHERMGKIVHAVMAIYIPFLAHDKDSENAHVVSKEVWDAAKAFAEDTEKFAQRAPSITPDSFEQKWTKYRDILLKQIDAFAMQMVTLMRHAAQVRRPFFGRTVGIVRMWQALSESTQFRDEKQLSARRRLQKLLLDTEGEFTRTHKEVSSFTEDLDAAITTRKESYTSLVGRIQAEINKYNPTKWDKVSKDYERGAKVDDDHLHKYREFIEKNQRAASLRAEIRV